MSKARWVVVLLLALLICTGTASAKRSGSTRQPSYKLAKPSYKYKPTVKGKRRAKNYCARCVRDRRGRIQRNPAANRLFRKANPCPATGKTDGNCPGYVIDHIVPLKRGGADAPANMQWQTKEDAKAKDRIED